MSSGPVAYVSGLASGINWRDTILQLRAVEHRGIDLISNRKADYEAKLAAWRELNTKLLAFKGASEAMRAKTSFDLLSVSCTSSSDTEAEAILTATAGASAVPGRYSIEVLQLAEAQKLSSRSFSSQNSALGTSYVGTVLINGRALDISSTDTLVNIRDKINTLNSGSQATGVVASIVSYSPSDFRLILTSETEGEAGIDLVEVGSSSALQALGLVSAATTVKHFTSDGAATDTFASSAAAVSTLLGLSDAPSGDVLIGGEAVTIDLSKGLAEIASDIDALDGVSARVASTTEDGATRYYIDISGTTSFTDDGNVLEVLGVLRRVFTTVNEVHLSDTANTKVGGGAVDAATTWDQVDTGGGTNNVSDGDTITIRGKKHDGTAVLAQYTISDKSTDAIQGLLSAIESSFGDVTAMVTAEGKIQVTDNTAGDSALSIQLIANNEGGGDLDLGGIAAVQQGYAMELQSGQNALLRVDGVYMARAANTITDAISGVTLDLKKAEPGTTVTLTLSRDLEGLVSKVEDFVAKYNDVMTMIQGHMSYDSEKKKPGGVLFGDGTLSSIKSDLMTPLVSRVWGVSQEFAILGMVGVNLDNQGRLSVAQSTLKGHLQSDFEEVKRLFLGTGVASVGTLDYLAHDIKTKAGTYAVNITQAPSQAAVTGITDLSGGLSADETLAVSHGADTAIIELTSGMSLEEVVAALNGELAASYSQVIVGDEVLYADPAMTETLRSSTTWGQIYDDSGTSAGLQDGDVILFSGTKRNGASVSGGYTISDINTDTIQGLLTAIQEAYGDTVVASIDPQGRITVSDRTDGTSSLSLAITAPEGRNLDFGVIDVSPDGEDGSRNGRYAIPVSASASSDGKYVILTHANYGSASSFTITQANDLILGSGKDGTYQGTDVAGTINGEAATGRGRTLTGDQGQPNVDGLAISYTGTSTGEVGSVTLTLGVAETLYRALFSITDSFEGYLAYKQDSLQATIDRLGTQIDEMEQRLDQRMRSLVAKFVAMEKALGVLQNQSSWLARQIETLGS
ncbi:MAG: flagellar filament capping protein FliD [Thermodesulfobacteriota bacterium]